MGLIGGAIKLIIIPIVIVVAIAVLGGLYLKHRRNKAAIGNDVEQSDFAPLYHHHQPPPVSVAPPPPVYAPSAVQYMGPPAAKPVAVATVQGYN